MTQVAPEQPLHRALGLTDEELDHIRGLLEREPNDFELAVFSLLWSEHCGYKHSALLLRRLPSEGARVLQGPGENAGVIDLGEGEAVAFKVESHNHPSAVEPFQGAATGVGGILRDIVAMGARPIALLDGLRFGAPDHHFSRAVAGIGHYGNSVGVATVGGETIFDEAYRDNCLVNAMCVGLLPADRVTRARATAIGAHVVLFGATTGRDGIGGASVLASAELGDDDGAKRPSVQIGDPFSGKKLIEASLELVEGGLVELSMAEIPIEETLRGAEALVIPQFAKKGVSYSHRAGDPTLTVFADRERVQECLDATGRHHQQPVRLGLVAGQEHRDERGKQMLPGCDAQDARCSALLEPKRRKRIERECQPRGQIAREEWRVIAPEPDRVDEREAADARRTQRGHLARHHRAEGMADQREPVELQRLQQLVVAEDEIPQGVDVLDRLRVAR